MGCLFFLVIALLLIIYVPNGWILVLVLTLLSLRVTFRDGQVYEGPLHKLFMR